MQTDTFLGRVVGKRLRVLFRLPWEAWAANVPYNSECGSLTNVGYTSVNDNAYRHCGRVKESRLRPIPLAGFEVTAYGRF